MKASLNLGRCTALALVVAGIAAGSACDGKSGAKAWSTGDSGGPSTATSPPAAPRKPECMACVLEDMRLAAHKQQVVVTARYLGVKERWLDEHRTTRRCTRQAEVMGVVRFALIGESPWRDDLGQPPSRTDLANIMALDLPCPELSRPEYAQLYRYDPDDTERDGLGHAPVLRPGNRYRLTLVRQAGIAETPRHPTDRSLVLTLVAVNPI
jgi:hypothetical protein